MIVTVRLLCLILKSKVFSSVLDSSGFPLHHIGLNDPVVALTVVTINIPGPVNVFLLVIC